LGAGLIALTRATKFGKSLQPIPPMVRIGGDALQVTVGMAECWGHGQTRNWPQPPRRQELGPRHMEGSVSLAQETDRGNDKHDPYQPGRGAADDVLA